MKYHILAIGISKHQNPKANLQFASKDAADFFSLFIQNVANVGYNKILADNEATLSAIQTALGSELQNQVGVDDGFVLFYSGHGAIAPDADGFFSHYLVPFDVTEDIPNSSIPVHYIREVFEKLKCKSKIFFVDSCFSGAMNSKSYGPNYKAIKDVKKLSDEISGEGSVIFTACQDEEKSIEDEILRNGVFTSFLLSELQLNKDGDRFSIIDLFTPISEKVSRYTQDTHHFKQTPTFKGLLKEILYLPTFKKPLLIKPELLDLPKSQAVPEQMVVSPEIDLTVINQSVLLDEMIKFVIRTSFGDIHAKHEFERFLLSIGKLVLKKWDSIFKSDGGVIENLPGAVAKLEAECYQLLVLSAVVGTYGDKDQAHLVGEVCGDLLKTTHGKSGLIAMINIPEVPVVFVEYVLALTGLVTGDFSKLKGFLATRIYGWDYNSGPPSMLDMYHTHFTEAFSGSADKVADYIRKSVNSMEWLKRLYPRLDVDANEFEALLIQTNFILVMVRKNSNIRAWPDFARFYSFKLLPLVERIKYDLLFEKSLAALLDVDPKELRKKLKDYTNKFQVAGLGGNYWWNSVGGDDLLTEQELALIKGVK